TPSSSTYRPAWFSGSELFSSVSLSPTPRSPAELQQHCIQEARCRRRKVELLPPSATGSSHASTYCSPHGSRPLSTRQTGTNRSSSLQRLTSTQPATLCNYPRGGVRILLLEDIGSKAKDVQSRLDVAHAVCCRLSVL